MVTVLPVIVSLACLVLQRADGRTGDAHLYNMLYASAVLLLLCACAVYCERRRCLPYLSAAWSPDRMSVDLTKYVYTLVVLIERSSDGFYRDQLQCEFNSFLRINNTKAYFADVQSQLETLLTTGNKY